MLSKSISAVSGIAAAVAVGVCLAAPVQADEPLQLKITTGGAGGIFFIQGGVIAEILKQAYPGSEINVFPGGAVGNIGVVSNGVADLGLTHINLYPNALKGKAPFKQKFENVAAVMKHGYYSYAQLFVSEDTGVKSYEDIKTNKVGLRLATTSKSGASYWMGRWLLDAYGVTEQDLEDWGGDELNGSFNDHVNWFRDGQVDAWAGGGHLPSNAPLQISQIEKVRLLSVDDAHLQELLKEVEGAVARTIPAGTYPKMVNADEDVQTFADPGGIVVRKDLPDDVVYKITKALVEHAETLREGAGMQEFDPETAWQNIGPLHPGAAKYFKERGWMN